MTKNIRTILVFFLLTFLPILLSLDPIAYDTSYHAKYKSPEGILFLSYTENWNEKKLMELYNELLLNKHGSEINLLQEVRVVGGSSLSDSRIKGVYHPLSNSITLFEGQHNSEPKSYRDTLAHEYGHHFAYYYFPTHHFSFSKWAELRGLNDTSVRWNSFWNYSLTLHKWHPQEIFAEDYVLMYGVTSRVNAKDVLTNEAFYLRTQHENQEIPNVLDNTKLQQYIENETGLKMDNNRRLKTPLLVKKTGSNLTFSISKRKNVAYRLNLSFYENNQVKNYIELVKITDDTTDTITFDILKKHLTNTDYITVSVDVVDLNTSLGFTTEEILLHLKDGSLYR